MERRRRAGVEAWRYEALEVWRRVADVRMCGRAGAELCYHIEARLSRGALHT